ncbi:MAG TPA: arsenate reductase (glutaredoxin) [Gammaproteobacteria bacterium]|nr:arsenate reductase (glutaredoxin) [Gammaproteobacteria bacterium]
MTITLFHNPRCSKSRAALALLRERGVEPILVEYLNTPPSREELRRIVKFLDIPPHDLLRRGEPEYRELGLEDPSVDDEAIFAAIAEHPILLERPIAIAGQHAVIGRPPERVLELL